MAVWTGVVGSFWSRAGAFVCGRFPHSMPAVTIDYVVRSSRVQSFGARSTRVQDHEVDL